jgi:hypothetical protein
MLVLLGVLFVARTIDNLPTAIATHFGGSGAPNGWMGRHTYAGYLAVVGLVLPLVGVTIIAWKGQGGYRAGRWWFGCLMVGFAIGIHGLILGAHRTEPPQLSTPAFLLVLTLFVVGLLIWVLYWRRPASPPG